MLVGFLGVGKTTLPNYPTAGDHGPRITVVVNGFSNDFPKVSVDAKLVRHASERLVELANRCIRCTPRDDLIEELADLAGNGQIVVASTGIGEPMPIAQAFHSDALRNMVRLDSIVAVVDGAHF